MALEMKVYKEIGSYEPKPMFGLTWRQIAAVAIIVILGGGCFALVTFLLTSHGVSTNQATTTAMWLIWPVLLPAAFWGWWRPKGLKPEKFLSFAVREAVMRKEVVYGTANRAESMAGGGAHSGVKARQKQVKALSKTVSER